MRLLGVDLGGTFIKAAVLDLEKQQVTDVRRSPFPPFLKESVPGSREVDANAVFNIVADLIRRYSSAYPDLSGLALSTQMHSLVLCTESGELLAPASTWQDTRSLRDGSFSALRDLYSPELSWEMGNECRVGHPIAVLHSLARANIPVITRPAIVTNLADWITMRLTGIHQPIHVSQAAATGLWSVTAGRWNDELRRELGLESLRMPVVSLDEHANEALVFGRRWKVWSPVGDQQASLLGVGLELTDMSVNVATGSQVSVLCSLLPCSLSTEYTIRPFFWGGLLATVTHLPAGRAINYWVAALGELAQDAGMTVHECWARLIDKASKIPIASLPDMDLSIFPCATGERGSVSELTEDNLSAASLFRSAIRSMATNYRWAASRLPGDSFNRVIASGGICQRIPMLRADISELIGLPVVSSPVIEDTLNGLLRYARAGA